MWAPTLGELETDVASEKELFLMLLDTIICFVVEARPDVLARADGDEVVAARWLLHWSRFDSSLFRLTTTACGLRPKPVDSPASADDMRRELSLDWDRARVKVFPVYEAFLAVDVAHYFV